MFLLRSDGMPEADRRLFSAVARVVVRGDLGELAPQLDRPTPWLFSGQAVLAIRRTAVVPSRRPRPCRRRRSSWRTALAALRPDGREYVVVLDGDRETPLPWSNVLANEDVRDAGQQRPGPRSRGRRTAARTGSRRLPMTRSATPTGEAIYLRDEDSGAVWAATPGPLPRRPDDGRWVVRHGAGVTRYQHATAGLDAGADGICAAGRSGQAGGAELTNTSSAVRRVSVYGYVEWCLGPPRAGERRFVVTERDEQTGALIARNPYNTEFSGRVAFWHTTEPAASFTVRSRRLRRHVIARWPGRPGSSRERLAGRSGAGLDPCAALQVALECQPGESRRVAFVLGQGRDASHAARPRRPLQRASRESTRRSAGPNEFWDRHARRHASEHAGRLLRSDRQPLAAVPDARAAGSGRAAGPYQPGGAYRIPRPAAGRARAHALAARYLPRAPAARRGAPVRRRRRAALVAPAERPGHEDALLR